MKKILFILLLASMSCFSQQQDRIASKYDVTRPNPKTNAQINSMTRMVEGSEAWNDTEKVYYRYVNGIWIPEPTSAGPTYTSGSGIAIDGSNVVSVDTGDAVFGNFARAITANTFTGGTQNFQNVDITLPGNLTTANSQTLVTSGSDPTGQATIMFLPNGLERPLTVTPTDILYNGTSLLNTGGSFVDLSSAQNIDGVKTFIQPINIGQTANNGNRIHFKTMSSNNVYYDSGDDGAIYFQNDGDVTFANGNGAGPGNLRFDWNANTQARTVTFPDKDGTVAMLDDVSGGSSQELERFLKLNARVATTGNITLSGGQTIDSNVLQDGDRVLVKDQTDATENGIYVVSTSGAWSRADDANSTDSMARALVYVRNGVVNFNKFYQTDYYVGTFGSTNITFNEVDLYGSGSGPGISNVVEDTTPELGGDLDGQGNSINNLSTLTASSRVNTEELRFAPDDVIGNTVDQNTFGFKTGNIVYGQKVNSTIEFGINFDALTADQNLIITDTDITWNGESLLTGNGIQSDASQVSGSSAVTNLVKKTWARNEATPPAGTDLIQTDVPLVDEITGTAIDFNEVPTYLDDRAVDTSAFTFTDADAGEEATIDLNQTTEPGFSGTGLTFTQLDGTTAWEADVRLQAKFKVQPNGTDVFWYYVKI